MKKILIVGASILQLPAIKKAKEKGYIVAVADRDINAIGKTYADLFYQVSTIDIDGILKVATEFKPDGIMTLATDMPMRAVANSASKLGLPGISIEAAENATDKGKMIKNFKRCGVASPWFHLVEFEDNLQEIFDKISYPCIFKPVDNAGSRGVVLVNRRDELLEAYKYSKSQSRNGEVIIEEYMQGHEVSVETMTVDGETYVLAITDKVTTGAPHFVEMGHSQQSRLPNETLIKIEKLAKQAINSVGIDVGPSHVEIMVTKEGPKVIELGARLGGDCITTHLIPLSTGIDMVGATIDLLTGGNPDIMPKYSKGSAIRYFNVPTGKIISVDGVEEAYQIKAVKEIALTKDIGDTVSEINSSSDRVGFIIAQGKDSEEAIQICDNALNRIGFRIDN